MAKKKTTKSKVATVISLCERRVGCTLEQISKTLRVSKVASSSLIGDARRKGAKIKCKQGADGVSRYYL
jgi:hypothetical protein